MPHWIPTGKSRAAALSWLTLSLLLCACDYEPGPPRSPDGGPQPNLCSHSEVRPLLSASSTTASASAPPSSTSPSAGTAYAFRRGLYSTMFVVAQGGVISFDPLAGEAPCLNLAIRAVAPGQLVQHVVYTTGRLDHVAGAGALDLASDVHVWASQQAAQELAGLGTSGDASSRVLQVTDPLNINADGMDAPYQLKLLGQELDLYYLGPTADRGTLAAHLPAQRAAMLVDVLLADTTPGVILAGLSPQAVMRTLTRLDRLDFDVLVPGHGLPATHADVTQTLAFWSSYLSKTQTALQGTTLGVPSADALDGAPDLDIVPQWPVQRVLSALQPDFGAAVGFGDWAQNGFALAYRYLLSESPETVPLWTSSSPMPPTRWQKVGTGAYYAQVGSYGSLVLDTDQANLGPLLVVDPLGPYAALLRGLIQGNLPNRRIGYIVYSHAHNEHIANASALLGGNLGGVRIYAHQNAVRDLAARQNPSVAQPTDTIMGSGTDLTLGTRTVHLGWYGPSHTDGDLVVYAPDAKVAMAVGLVQKGALPGMMPVGASPAGLLQTMTALGAMDVQVYLTGEGGWLVQQEFQQLVTATHDLFALSAAALQAAPQGPVPLDSPAGPALRDLVVHLGAQIGPTLTARYPSLQLLSLGAADLGEMGVTYCSAQAATFSACQGL